MQATERQWVVDSIEENTAAVEQDGRGVYQVPLFLLPPGVREGDICSVTAEPGKDATVTITVALDRKSTSAAKERSAAQLATAPKSKDPGGPINL